MCRVVHCGECSKEKRCVRSLGSRSAPRRPSARAQARRCASPARPVQARGPPMRCSPNTLLSCACGPVSVCVESGKVRAGHPTYTGQRRRRDDERRASLPLILPIVFLIFPGAFTVFRHRELASSLCPDLCARRRGRRAVRVKTKVACAGRAAAPMAMRAHAMGRFLILWLCASLLNAFQR